MHCASCAAIIEKTLIKTDGVKNISVNYGTEAAKINFDEATISPQTLSQKIEPLGYSLIIPAEEVSANVRGGSSVKKEVLKEIAAQRRKVLTMLPLALVSVFVMGWDIFGQFGIVPVMPYIWKEFFHHLLPIMATYALFVVGTPYLMGVYRFIRHGAANMDTLIGIGTSTAFLYSFIVSAFEEQLAPFVNVEHTYYDVTIVVIAFITLGKYLETRSKAKTGDAIEKLLNLQEKSALVIRGGKEMYIPVAEVVVGDYIVIKPAGKIPVDGIIIEGASSIDEAMLTGESLPVDKKIGDGVIGGTLNLRGALTMEATKVGNETMLARIITMVENAQGSKAPIQTLADTVSSYFVPAVLGIAVATLGVWLSVGTAYLGFSQALSLGLVSFVGILVIACPCALGLATPIAIIVGVGKGASRGILIRDAESLERLSKVDTVVMDKTGTLTKGTPEVTDIVVFDTAVSEEEIVRLAGAVENKSEHPLAEAIVLRAKQGGNILPLIEHFEAHEGIGVEADVEGMHIAVLKLEKNHENNRCKTLEEEGKTVVRVVRDGRDIGYIALADTLKEEAAKTIDTLRSLGITVVMLTGDNVRAAEHIAQHAHIDRVIAGVLPTEKAAVIQKLQSEGQVVAMVGDGINDAPALAEANVGIAMATGTDIAIESAGITLLHGDIAKLVEAITLSRATLRTVKQNLFWAFAYNVIGIPIAAGVLYPLWGIVLSPVFAGIAMGGSSVSVVLNALRLKTKKLT